MIEEIHIQNFKSLYDLKIKTGRINLFIGENGSGKSNLLEALVFVSAAEANKLDNEFLVSRGIRVTEPTLMRSAFDLKKKKIKISVRYIGCSEKYIFENDDKSYSNWTFTSTSLLRDEHLSAVHHGDEGRSLTKEDNILLKKIDTSKLLTSHFYEKFIIYSPENTSLRIFSKEGQIQPLGINGEGLLKLLKVINNYEDKSYINTIIESLQLFNWFENITMPSDISSAENKVVIKDKYLYKEFDQRSANEGFLFILFYITLIVAKETPKAFAIDNIDASLNPKLCTKLMLVITELAKKYDKQIFLTTHNPAILDGIDLNDEEQKLFVVSRNKLGHTRMKNITLENKPRSSDNEPLRLSEAFLRGYLGGLPKGF